ncbi:hypothetical protein HanXRQr2_Chr13g0619641 [Helianthus annuus]|uniref:Concanavalin A-like lectin/glucanase domain-containing protein n=2 Tax=Helianthus annuus TaxID=4232 RepID=A0A9K3HDA2_HELAN|nr:uncharacterized protein LOC110889004 [Helianthus annuus]KAF5776110.1 hypothetical protein HanXRQr2_Chr13g0619641 [Helianthus annuus]KAJ0479056.1 hypothetical protein HanHA300_Chr13g0506651 [Helianthus annuus]KAJ0665895.1 hypothetical protein HanLR1_Chr13g0508761 [Helianthus annuus]KAJ0851679.1 hypothetical protein HanPSC8_Chr13g0594841 [Helianthus annuus]
MGFETRLIIISFVMLSCLLNPSTQQQQQQLDDMFEEYALNSLPTRPQTGVLYNASSSLPSNFTGVQLSMVRLRWDSFWRKGANYSGFLMPPRIFAYPFFTRLDIVYSNLGNQSSFYYNVPNHTLVAPVVGFNIYASGNLTKLNLTLFGGPILVEFPVPQHEKAKCVMFYSNGTYEMSNMTTQENMCSVRDQGHFSMVVPQVPSIPIPEKKDRGKLWKWWVFGFAVGVLGLLLVGFIVFVLIRIFRMTSIAKMEKEAEKNEVLGTTNVGQSKMPLATVVRTQPTIENDYVP